MDNLSKKSLNFRPQEVKKLICLILFLVVNFFAIVININSATAIKKEFDTVENQINTEQNKLVTINNILETQIREEVKRKQKSSPDEIIDISQIGNLNNLPPATKD